MRSFYLMVTTLLLISLGLLAAASTPPNFTATPAMATTVDVDASNTDPVSGLNGMR